MKPNDISTGLNGYHVILLCSVASRCRKGMTTVEDAKTIETVADAILKHLAEEVERAALDNQTQDLVRNSPKT